MRVAHSRFNKGIPVCRGEAFTRIVTSVWSFESETAVLTYGATIFKKDHSKDHWNRKKHLERAVERFTNNPIRIVLKAINSIPEISNISMDWYIAQNLIYKFGTHNTIEPDIRRIQGTTNIYPDFNTEYDSLSDKFEEEFEEEFEEQTRYGYYTPLRIATFMSFLYLSYSYLT